MMGEIKVALKKEVKTEGDQLVLEILQCRNITYKFKSPDHLPGGGTSLVVSVQLATTKYLTVCLIHSSSFIKCVIRSVCQAVRGERCHAEEDHQEEDQSLPTRQGAVFQ